MTQALICLDGYRVGDVLDAAATTLHPSLTWLLLFVSDTRPEEEVARALSRLPGRGPGRHRAEARLHDADQWSEAQVQAEARTWLTRTGREAELIVTSGRPEREILRVAEERGVGVIALGGGRGLAGRYPGPGSYPLSPVARYVIDHARGDVLLLRRYVAPADRRA
jgi:nucleotide-binding universal stress UspA family protein